ncbi:MAG: PAS domain S-box protein [Bacteroidales bacterium]|nr:PAS domain S-box protein [Bacteroidales bacterium]MDD3906976.1 PAS domain S-box protein [Bacteroidales bacterium]
MNSLDYDAVFDLLLKNSSTCDLLVDLDGNIYRYNEAYKDLIGYDEEEIKHQANTLYVSQEAYEREIAFVNQVLSGEKSDVKFRSSRLTKSGKVVQVEVTSLVFKDHLGHPNFVLKRIVDITEKVQIEEEEKKQQLYLQTILDEMPLNIYFKDLESRFMILSKCNIGFLGCKSIDEVKGKTDFDFFQEEHAREAYEDEQYIIRTGKNIVKEEKEVRKNNKITYALTNKAALKDQDGNIIGTYGISKDITAIKLAEEKTKQMNKELALKNAKLQETIEELSRTQNKLIFAEKMAALGSLIGGIAHEINTPLGAIKASSSNIQDVVEKINVDLPWVINHASPEEICWLFKLINEVDARDISVFTKEERKRKRELTTLFEDNQIENAPNIADTIVSLRINQSDESLLEMIKLPNTQSLLQILKVLSSLKRNANNIAVSVEKASSVVRALKNYIYKNNQGDCEATNLRETIETVLILTSNMIKHSKTEIVTKFESIPLVFCKQDEMCQIWTNVITNAIQAMGEGGTLEIGTTLSDNDTIKIWFKDTGCGIAEEVKPRIFEPYFTTKGKGVGTGMGLDISRQIVENHHGKIYFESEAGKGTTFFIEIPINQDAVKIIK